MCQAYIRMQTDVAVCGIRLISHSKLESFSKKMLGSIHTSINVCVCVCVCVKLQHCVYGMLHQMQRMCTEPILCVWRRLCKKKRIVWMDLLGSYNLHFGMSYPNISLSNHYKVVENPLKTSFFPFRLKFTVITLHYGQNAIYFRMSIIDPICK